MKITVVGTGYVGLVTGACLAHVGFRVTCLDIDKEKIKTLKKGECPIVEKDLPERIQSGLKTGNLEFTTDAKSAIGKAEVIFIAVGTPSIDGREEADLSAVFAVANTIRKHANGPKVVVQKSTVPVGTGDEVEKILNKTPEDRGTFFYHDVVSNPEFLKEGMAIRDFEFPERVVVGTVNGDSKAAMNRIYAPFMRTQDRMIFVSRPSAELIKVFANAMLAMRISAMNAITPLAERFGADVTEIRRGVGSDSRIGPAFLFPGGATFGGSCFPKDVRALIALMESSGMGAGLFREVMNINRDQRTRFIEKVFEYFRNKIAGKRFAVWGLSFKPSTDDVREAASLDVIRAILRGGGEVVAFDLNARKKFEQVFGPQEGLSYSERQYETTDGADALIVLTDAMEFRSLDSERLREVMKKVVVFDGKNLHDPRQMASEGVHYVCMGRPFFPPEDVI